MNSQDYYKRPAVLDGRTTMSQCGCGHLYVTVNRSPADGGIVEVFPVLGKCGGCAAAQTEVMGRLISRLRRYGIPLEKVIIDLRGVRCPQPIHVAGEEITSCSDAVGRVLAEELEYEKTEDFAIWKARYCGGGTPTPELEEPKAAPEPEPVESAPTPKRVADPFRTPKLKKDRNVK